MSFIGAVAGPVRQAIANWSRQITLDCLVIGAGNFTVPSAMISGGYAGKFQCCDISLYTSVLGAYLSDQDVEISESPDCPEHLQGLLDISDATSKAATVALIYDLREVYEAKNKFQRRILDATRQDWESLKNKTRVRLETFKKHMAGRISYEACDGFDFLQRFERQQHVVLAFPPTYRAGYEKLEKLLTLSIKWDAPKHQIMTDLSTELYHQIAEYAGWFVVLEKDLTDIYPIIGKPQAILPRGRGKKTFIVAGGCDTSPIVVRKQAKSASPGRILSPEYRITGKENITFSKLSLSQSIRLNELFMASHIEYFTGGVSESFGFYLDGFLFGKADFAPTTHEWKLPENKKMIYLMSDLSVPSDEQRLSKLVLMCLMSKEIKRIIDLHYVEDFRYVATTAFSKNPVSMKYRGLFKLHKRTESGTGWLLNYFSTLGQWPLENVMGLWNKKYRKN